MLFVSYLLLTLRHKMSANKADGNCHTAKALELFMISLVTKAASEAKSRNSKRVSAAHLKSAVAKDEVLDFLAEIIAKVPDAPAPSEKAEDTSDAAEGKKRRGGARKKRKDSGDDF